MKLTLYDHAYETFAIQYLAATCKSRGIETEVYFDCSMDKDYLDQDFFLTSIFSLTPGQIAEGILATRPDVVGFSLITAFYRLIRPILRELKSRRPELIIIAGGPHATLATAQTLENPDIDFVFVGDADTSLPQFMADLKTHGREAVAAFPPERAPGMWNRVSGGGLIERGMGPVLTDLDAQPFPEKDDYYRKNPSLRILYTATCSRGCIYSCTYCNSNTLRQKYRAGGHKYFRVRSVANVIAELKQAKAKYRPRYIMFIDNLFAPDREWLREFSAAYRREIDLPFFCETNPNVHDRESLELLAAARCTLLQFGFQSANETVRREVLHRYETNDRIREVVKYARQLGMFVCIDHIANLPGEKREHLDEAVALYRELRPDWVNLGFLQFLPEADIIEIALARRAIGAPDIERIYRGEAQTSFRLLKEADLGEYYRTLPMRLFAAFKAPPRLGDWLLKRLDSPRFARLVSPFGSLFIYASRILNAFIDRRDFLVRHHILRNLYVMKTVFVEKYLKHG